VIPLRAKVAASVLIGITIPTSAVLFVPFLAAKIAMGVIGLSVILWIWYHPHTVRGYGRECSTDVGYEGDESGVADADGEPERDGGACTGAGGGDGDTPSENCEASLETGHMADTSGVGVDLGLLPSAAVDPDVRLQDVARSPAV
jgi:hypothetical protein